ncbi:MAG TPA: GDSL-type esterase/lipase family protein [Ramlibacter sp.]|jgi:lysophospholipase L1-like esterase|uniref:GDSL-type esterase/lipase family protein n=1 Tax=Ramlibacter sp. TaxID=1917967 RepID=UPI002D3D3943|nr:GDSL-type esterase/lipase family protein [Ramlibacter sp.]HZY17699.1 GDSL-type esterase/lipase family protein [Ramlibacter sp.]
MPSLVADPLLRTLVAPPIAFAASAAAALLLAQLRRVRQARTLCECAPAVFTRSPASPSRRVLLVGDSTGAGVGCEHPRESIAARLADEFPDAEVRNLCLNGATVADVLRTVRGLPAGPRFDLVLVFAGGNDVLKRTPWAELESGSQALLGELQARAGQVLWAGMANVGLAPLFLPPFSWWMTARTRRANRLLARQARRAGARFVDFFREKADDPFSADPQRFYARDRVHPSAQAYAWCYAQMRPAIAAVLAA